MGKLGDVLAHPEEWPALVRLVGAAAACGLRQAAMQGSHPPPQITTQRAGVVTAAGVGALWLNCCCCCC
jgi:hypothetical protein